MRNMNRKWYQNIAVPPAIVSGIFILLAAFLRGPIASILLNESHANSGWDLRPPQDVRDDTKEVLPIRVIPRESCHDVNEYLINIRRQGKLRGLTPLETGRSIFQTSIGTYCFVCAKDVEIYKGNVEKCLSMATVKSFRQSQSDFEIHCESKARIFLLAYVGDDIAAALSKPVQNTIGEIVIFPLPWSNFTNLVIIPISRIIQSNYRKISITKDKMICVLDIVIH
jgi:hypothetical protein